jgi:hypothetical protein
MMLLLYGYIKTLVKAALAGATRAEEPGHSRQAAGCAEDFLPLTVGKQN